MLLRRISLLLISLSFGQCLNHRFEILTDDYGHTIGRVPDPESDNNQPETDDDAEADYDELHDPTTTATPITEDDDDEDDEQGEEEKEAIENNENDDDDDDDDSLFDQATMMNQSRSMDSKDNSTGSTFDGDDHIQQQFPPERSQKRLSTMGKGNAIAKSLIIKVYRGPTKMIEQKPFASWGYFIKFPNI